MGETSGRKIVLLYNDRDRPAVTQVYQALLKPRHAHGVVPWMASEDMTAFGDMFDNIEEAISTALGVVVFLGAHGLGRFQRNIELGCVSTEQWQKGASYGALLVHLAPHLEVPRKLLRWPTVNHDGALAGPNDLAGGILVRFGLRTAAPEKQA